jgi:hypothetical protein
MDAQLVLRHQLNVLTRKWPKQRVAVGNIDRLVFCGLYRGSPKVLGALKILQRETVVSTNCPNATGPTSLCQTCATSLRNVLIGTT